MTRDDLEAAFKAAIINSYQTNGRARTVTQGAQYAWDATKHLFGDSDDEQ